MGWKCGTAVPHRPKMDFRQERCRNFTQMRIACAYAQPSASIPYSFIFIHLKLNMTMSITVEKMLCIITLKLHQYPLFLKLLFFEWPEALSWKDWGLALIQILQNPSLSLKCFARAWFSSQDRTSRQTTTVSVWSTGLQSYFYCKY